MALSDDLLTAVKELSDELGKSLVFETVTKTGDPTTGIVTESNSVSNTIVAAIFNAEEKYVDGDLIRKGDLQTVLPAQSIAFTPIKGMKVTFDSETWETVRVDKIWADEFVVAYMVFMRN
jgi:hypothetical protein